MHPDFSALAAANSADETRLDITQPDIIGPLVGDRIYAGTSGAGFFR
jgi:hypothetical protein